MLTLQPRTKALLTAAASTLGYAASAVALTWPLARHLTTALLGDPTGDTGVYVWNVWIFRHELLNHGHLPFSTNHIFASTGPVDFSLHNYTPIADLVAMPLVPWLGVVGAFNVVLLAILTASGVGVFLLGRQIGLRRVSAFAAGELFIASPLVSAREIAHLSLVTNLALPLLLWALLRTIDQPRLRRGAVVGLVVAAATYSDAYYGIYCVCMSLILLAWRFLRVECTRSVNAPPAIRLIDVLSLAIATTVMWRLVSGTTGINIGPVRVGMETLHTPMLALVVLGGLRLWLRWQPVLRVDDREGRLRALIAPGMVAVFVCLALLSPLLVGIASRYVQGRLPDISTYWRSSPRGVDLLAYVVPNPNHPWFGQWTRRWLLPDTADAFPEFVAGFSLLALIGILVAGWQRALPGLWVAFTATFVLLSLGPFIHVGGINTFVIGPWALLRYIPIIGMARAPSRFSIVAAMGLSLLFGFALNAWLMSRDKRWTMSLAVLALLIGLEVLPAPRALYAAQVPDIYRWVTAVDDASDQGRLLELPTGIRDGTSSIGDFNASTEFFQTKHGRPLIGGYLSRVSTRRKTESLQMPMLRALYKLSEGARSLPEELLNAARQSSETFLARTCVKYVVVDKRRASIDLRTFALDALGLVAVQEDERYQLLIPARAPTCAPSSRPLDGW